MIAIIQSLVINAVSSLERRIRRMRRGDYLYNGEDLISQLPDDVLVSIIARIPTANAVATSTLSKRWRNLYKSMSTFQLCCSDLLRYIPYRHPHGSFFDFAFIIYRLEGVLRLCSGFNIHTFELQCCFTRPNDKRFERCIYYLGKSGVKQLKLYLSCCSCPSCRRPSFSCHHLLSELTSLEHLNLGRCSLQPYSISKCHNLQTLKLSLCTLAPGFLECVLSNCVCLESLSLHCCDCPPKICIRGPSLQLKTLVIYNCESAEEIELYASNLYEFEYISYRMANLVFDHVPQLEIMYMYVNYGNAVERANAMPCVFGEVAKYVPGLKSLTMVTKGADFKQEGLQMGRFGNLRVLDLSITWTPRSSNLLGLIPYLESCPVLEELQLNLPDPEVVALSSEAKRSLLVPN